MVFMNTSIIPDRDAYSWVWEEADQISTDLIVLCGNHSFRWGAQLQSTRPENKVMIVHTNALNYLDLRNRKILLLADEVEFGRQLYEVFDLCRDRGISALFVRCFFLNSSRGAISRRGASIQYLRQHRAGDALFADALQAIRGWKNYSEDQDFHCDAIINLGSNMRRVTSAPINADATIVRLQSPDGKGGILQQIYAATLPHGWWYQPSEYAATLVLAEYCPLTELTVFQDKLQVSDYRALFKFYKPFDGMEVVASPMVHAKFHVQPDLLIDFSQLTRGTSDIASAIVSAGFSRLDAATDKRNRLLAFYDLLSFSFDLELISYLKLISGITMNVFLDKDSLLLYYGPDTGEELFQVGSAFVTSGNTQALSAYENSARASDDEHFAPTNVDIAQLMFCKGNIYEEFERANEEAQDPILCKRTGLCFDDLYKRTGIDLETLTCCIDTLCELEWTEPFNDLVLSADGIAVIARYYNSTHGGLRHFMMRLISALRLHRMPTHLMFLNKYLSFLIQTLKNPPEDAEVEGYHYGKLVKLKVKDYADYLYLDDFLKLEKNTFRKLSDGQYVVEAGVDTGGDLNSSDEDDMCIAVIPRDLLDIGLEQLYEINEVVCKELEKYPPAGEEDESPPLLSHAIASFVDMLGSTYPENGFFTIATNLRRAYYHAEIKREFNKALMDLQKMQEKISMIRSCDPILEAIYRKYAPKIGLMHIDRLMGRFAYLPARSPIWRLLSREIELAQKALKKECELGPLSTFASFLAELSCEEDLKLGRPPLSEEVHRIIVSVDMRGSKLATPSSGGEHWKSYALNILGAWAHWFGGEWVNDAGDEGIYAFSVNEKALAFVGAAWYHLNGLSQTILRKTLLGNHSGFGVGIAAGRIVRRQEQGRDCVIAANGAPFDSIARASGLAKNGIEICEDTGWGKEKRHLYSHELFEKYTMKHLQNRWVLK
jgi:hypothetical protein